MKEELERAQHDAGKYCEDVTQTQELYQRELMQHGKSVQTLMEVKEQVHTGGGGSIMTQTKKKMYIILYVSSFVTLVVSEHWGAVSFEGGVPAALPSAVHLTGNLGADREPAEGSVRPS